LLPLGLVVMSPFCGVVISIFVCVLKQLVS